VDTEKIMQVVMRGVGFPVLLMVALGTAMPSFAQPPQTTPSDVEQPGSVVVFPKFTKGTVAADGVTRVATEIEVRAQCPRDTSCPEGEPVKVRFHWVCPGSEDISAKHICKDAAFTVVLSVGGKASFSPEDPGLAADVIAAAPPCSKGYLIGWVIDPTTDRPIKYDGLTGTVVLRDSRGAIDSYEAIAIPAEPNLAMRADIATDIDSRTGSPALVFDGGPGHYQAVARAVPLNLEHHKFTGPLSSSEAVLIVLTLDVRLNRPNYPTFIDLDFAGDAGAHASASWKFTCWTEVQNPKIDANLTLAGARLRNGIVISGQAIKVPVAGISDIPGPVALLGLVPAEKGRGHPTMDPAYIIKTFDDSKPTTVFLPFD
jgi:hypothetical protein